MLDDRTIRTALQRDASEFELPPDLLTRIQRQADATPRRSLWARLGPKLEIAAACILVASLIGVAALRHLQQTPSFSGGPPVVEPEGPVPSPSAPVFSGDATDGTLRTELHVTRQANGDWSVLATFQSLTASDLEVRGGCNLVSLEGLWNNVVRSCPLEHSVVPAGGSAQTRFVLHASDGDLPTAGTVNYVIRSEGSQDPARALTIPLRPGPGTTRDPSSVVDLLLAAGLRATLTSELPTQLFGAKQADHIIAEGVDVVVYRFDGTLSADHAWRMVTNPAAHTVSFAHDPEFVQMGLLIVQIDYRDRFMAERIKAALLNPKDHELAPKRPLPRLESVKAAHLPGGPRLPEWHLTEEGIQRVITMLQGAEVITEAETPPQPSSGLSQPLLLYLELTSGDTIVIRQAADCSVSTGPVGSPQISTCTDSTEQILFFERGRMRRLRAPALAQWLAGAWRHDAWQ